MSAFQNAVGMSPKQKNLIPTESLPHGESNRNTQNKLSLNSSNSKKSLISLQRFREKIPNNWCHKYWWNFNSTEFISDDMPNLDENDTGEYSSNRFIHSLLKICLHDEFDISYQLFLKDNQLNDFSGSPFSLNEQIVKDDIRCNLKSQYDEYIQLSNNIINKESIHFNNKKNNVKLNNCENYAYYIKYQYKDLYKKNLELREILLKEQPNFYNAIHDVYEI